MTIQYKKYLKFKSRLKSNLIYSGHLVNSKKMFNFTIMIDGKCDIGSWKKKF